MQIQRDHLLQYLRDYNSDGFTLEHLVENLGNYKLAESRAKLVSSTLKGIIDTNSVFHDSKLSEQLFSDLGAEGYLEQIIPKLNFGRRQGHSTGVANFLKENPTLNVVIATCSSCMVSELQKTILQHTKNTDNFVLLSFGNPSSMRKIPSNTDVIIVDEQPHPRSTSREALLDLVKLSVIRGVPLIILGTSY